MGNHCIKAWSKTQAVIAKSSAESELYGVVRGACEGLGVKTLCEDMGSQVSVRLELDATAAKGILDRQGLAKVRHIDVNCLWLQEQCAKKLIPLEKIPGEHNSADLMTKHLASPVIIRHTEKLSLEFRGGRAEKAAKLHSVVKRDRQASALRKADRSIVSFGDASKCDYWSERGEKGRWVRVHVTPRTTSFAPGNAPRGPGRKTRLVDMRSTQGVDSVGRRFQQEDDWTRNPCPTTVGPAWTGRTTFLVDKNHTNLYGTDQRRQRIEVSNFSSANADMNLDYDDGSSTFSS